MISGDVTTSSNRQVLPRNKGLKLLLIMALQIDLFSITLIFRKVHVYDKDCLHTISSILALFIAICM